MNQPLLYSLVAKRGAVVLAESTSPQLSTNANLIAVRILESIKPGTEIRSSFNQDGYNFHVLASGDLIFIVMASQLAGMVKPFAFLNDISRLFQHKYGDSVASSVAYELNEFSTVMEERMHFFSSDSSDPLQRVKGQLEEVKGVMVENLEKVLERGEKLELLVEKTESLQNVALNFRREGRVLHRTFVWRNVRMYAILVLAGLSFIYFVVGLACGFKLDRC